MSQEGWGGDRLRPWEKSLATHSGLAHEYAHILLSYAREDGTILSTRDCSEAFCGESAGSPRKDRNWSEEPPSFFCLTWQSQDGMIRGLSARIMGLLQAKEAQPMLRRLTDDESELIIMDEHNLTTRRVKDLAEEALRLIG